MKTARQTNLRTGQNRPYSVRREVRSRLVGGHVGGTRTPSRSSSPSFEHRRCMYAQDWGEERNRWLVDLSFTVAGVMGTAFLLGLLFLFRVPVLRLLAIPMRPLNFLVTWVRIIVIFTPLRHPCRRYLYVGRHLQLREA